MGKHLKDKHGKFAGSIGDGKHKVPQSRDLVQRPRTDWGINRAIRKNADAAAQFVVNYVAGKYDATNGWTKNQTFSIPGVSDNDLDLIASMTKSKHLVDDWYAACRKHQVDSLTAFKDMSADLQQRVAFDMVESHYRKYGTPHVGGM